MSKQYDAVVCGAGICGVSAAYFLARSGMSNILVVDDRPPLSLTSNRSTECYRNWWPDPALISLMNRSIDLLEQLADESHNVFHLNRRGYLYVTGDPGKVSAVAASAERISKLGGGPIRIHESAPGSYAPLVVDGFHGQPDGADLLIGSSLISRFFPYLTPDSVAALHVRRAGWLSAQQLGTYLLEQARIMGVQTRIDHLVAVDSANGVLKGVRLQSGGTVECSTFINAAGPYLTPVSRLLGIDLPLSTELHLMAVFRDSLGVLRRDAPLLVWDDTQTLGWQPEEMEILDADVGTRWLTSPLASGCHTRPEGPADSNSVLMLWDFRKRQMDPMFPLPLDEMYAEITLRGLATMLPGLRAYIGHTSRPQVDGGYYVKTPENRLLAGPLPVAGAYVLGAASGYGIMAACAAGELITAHVTGAALPSYAAAFSPDRYADPAYTATLPEWTDSGQL